VQGARQVNRTKAVPNPDLPDPRALSKPPAGQALPRYLAVGGAATLAHWAFMALCVEGFGITPWVSSGWGAAVGAQVAFFANLRFTFGHVGALWPAWWRFMGTAVIGALVGMAIVAAGVRLGAHYLLAQAAATTVGVLLTFAINRAWTFKS
jgi:putative flippase GtrA